MAKCPKCDKEIDHILALTDATQVITKDTEEPKWEIDHEWITYCCPNPECSEQIVDSFDEAISVLKGGK